jgi:feruloyl esterase
MKVAASALISAALAALLARQASPASGSCEAIRTLKLPNTTITMADAVEAGKANVQLPGGGSLPPAVAASLPAFCRVAATIAPTPDSDIKMEVWLPASGWNGKFAGVGNGGWAGTISYPSLLTTMRRGYAVTSTDTGHDGNAGDGSFALGHPEKLIDFAWRSVHETTVAAKAIVNTFYGRAASAAYWNGCSTGGKQGLTETQRFPDDYDGIVIMRRSTRATSPMA